MNYQGYRGRVLHFLDEQTPQYFALVHDAYRQDHAPRAEEVAEKKRDAPPQGFWSLKVAQN